MAKAKKKAVPARPRTPKRRARRTAQTAGSGIDQLVDVQQRTIGRIADFSSSVANKIAAGDFNIANWARDYSAMWSDASQDLSSVAKAVLQTSARPRQSKKARGKARTTKALRGWLALQQSLLQRAAEYSRGVGELVATGSFAPQNWIADGATFWSHVIGDLGDWAHLQSGATLRPNTEWIPRFQKQLRSGKLADHIEVEVPIDAFPAVTSADRTMTLSMDGLIRVGGGLTLQPKVHLSFNPPQVQPASPRTQLQLHDLPPLRAGDVFVGIVRANEANVAAIVIEIV